MVELLEETIGEKLLDTGPGNDFFCIWHQKHKPQKQKLVSGTTAN